MDENQSTHSTKAKSSTFLSPTILSSLRSVLVVISTALIGFAAFRNTLTWHLQRFWGASGDFWQALWDQLLDVVGEDFTVLWVYGNKQIIVAVINFDS